MATLKTAPTRRARREPAYFYRSAAAVIEGDVRFGEGCVVLPHARLVVPPGCRLNVGPYTLVADFAEVNITAAPVSAAAGGHAAVVPPSNMAPPTLLQIGTHNHIHSYARLHFELPPTPVPNASAAKPKKIELLGAGNCFHSFSSLHVCLPAPSADDTQTPWQLGSFNVCAVHTHLRLSPPPPTTAPLQHATRGASGQEGVAASPAPTMPSLGGGAAQNPDVATAAPSVELAMPGRVSVEERLFQKNSSDDDGDDVDKSSSSGSRKMKVGATTATREGTYREPTLSLPLEAAASTRINNHVFLPGPASANLSAIAATGREAAATGVPRYGTRSVSELPTIIKRILDDEKRRRGVEEGGFPQRHATAVDAAAVSESASPVAAAAAALTNLSGYVESVHPDLRAQTEERVLAETERVCRFYIRQYIEDSDLCPVDGQDDDSTALKPE